MKLLSILNPQKWLGQIVLLASVISSSFFYGMYIGTKNCAPTTQINNDIKNKKGTLTTLTDLTVQTPNDCIEWLRGLSMKEVREARR